MLVYFNGDIVQMEKVAISPFDRGFQFADGVYEVIRYYPKKFFKIGEHLERLRYSLYEMQITPPSLDNVESILNDLITKNNLTDELSIAYLQITRGHQFPRRHIYNENLNSTFFISVESSPAKIDGMINGVRVGVEEDIRWMRCDIKSTSLLPNTMLLKNASRKGYSENILHRNGIITEGTHTNLCFVKDSRLATPPLSNFILAGITRKTVLDLCTRLGIAVEERSISISELKYFDEIFLLGTTLEVTPIIEVEGVSVNDGKPGTICRLLQKEYSKLYNSD
jgi:D-alanine transaminase